MTSAFLILRYRVQWPCTIGKKLVSLWLEPWYCYFSFWLSELPKTVLLFCKRFFFITCKVQWLLLWTFDPIPGSICWPLSWIPDASNTSGVNKSGPSSFTDSLRYPLVPSIFLFLTYLVSVGHSSHF